MLRECTLAGRCPDPSWPRGCTLTASTVASLVSELVGRGIVLERPRSRLVPQSPGRPSPVVELRQSGPGALALDIATDWLGAAVVGLGGKIIAVCPAGIYPSATRRQRRS